MSDPWSGSGDGPKPEPLKQVSTDKPLGAQDALKRFVAHCMESIQTGQIEKTVLMGWLSPNKQGLRPGAWLQLDGCHGPLDFMAAMAETIHLHAKGTGSNPEKIADAIAALVRIG